MCGIFAYMNFIKDKKLKDILIKLLGGLKKLEYRGYDSCGIAFDIGNEYERMIVTAKSKGTVDNLLNLIKDYLTNETIFENHVAIAHTRWATHGPPTAGNAHPHISSPKMEFVVVHNGIISNYAEMKNRLLQEPTFSVSPKQNNDDTEILIEDEKNSKAEFTSETDTEVLAKLALFMYNKLTVELGRQPTFLQVIANTMKLVEGTFGAVFKSSIYPNEVIACRLSSPLLLGLVYDGDKQYSQAARSIDMKREDRVGSIHDFGEPISHSAPKPGELFLASDAPAFAEYTKNVIILEDWDIVHISEEGVDIINTAPTNVQTNSTRSLETLQLSLENIAKGKYGHFMHKEIMEQPQSLASTMRGRILPGSTDIHLGGMIPHIDTIKNSKYLIFIACGTSYNAALAVRPLFEQYTKQRIFVEVASDFNDRKPVIFRDDVCVFLSQSGETADTLTALEYCKSAGAFCVGINNTPGSSISRGTHCGIHLNAGIEIGVASTKCYTSMIEALIMFLLLLMQDSISQRKERKKALQALASLPSIVEETLKLSPTIQEIAPFVANEQNLIMLGRKTHYATARETALKIKELTYIHSEGLMAGELKHGPLALIDDHSMVIFIATGEDDEMLAATQSSLQQIKARGAKVLVVATQDDIPRVKEFSDWLVIVPKTCQWTQMIVNIIPMQLLAYYVALQKGINVDRPRNLAKAVTVA
ncbi:glucosamine--fructose-6-phosphate aminotransferase, isomerizing family protein [Trichomonas vaginalis G3]|uniref:glutamine--fructose-6-phosphate transaminase (isomerizing) n=1 Tax=Trichomonas vaginalis (strain ATCC PRA-98 / G3) TaxID=412133 RepID=A2DZU8_TRIV3|nr:glutamine-fructose-6-phosphate transaminase (isomerizing) protein [Trichomonas vaginalis G3]EAY14007.1 glucosamine--fructose-6-phosphate aminotransferase, isomerizing family protein [Trichomonas vaginalis G3]KAI5519559.1 glutamine-fructose-6-phosphate transaminase (isomerizing) protein [Trichomonas vaginalis G3]|eukprot:XP_001326230.1 glucosamine--fructose-6-phosphate aminotransferase, isomerizing family protein [Trichomonas vaginalis G3]